MMDGLLKGNPLLVTLGGVALLLAVVVALEARVGMERQRQIGQGTVRPAAAFEAKLLPPVAPGDPAQAYPEMAARPLFIPTRRPAPPQVVQQNTFQRGQFVLLGTILVGDNRTAMLREKSTGHIHRVQKGQQVNGISVAEITPEGVTLAQGAESENVPLTVQKAAPPPAGAAAPPQSVFGPAVPGTPGVAPPGPGGQQPGGQQPGAPAHPGNPAPGGAAPVNPAAVQVPQATTAPMTPEEILARRRARRAQTNP